MDAEYQIDKRQLRDSFSRAAADYDALAVLQQEIGRRLLERLDLIKLQPQRILDVGCGTGRLTKELSTRYPKAELIGLDIAHGMLQQARGKPGLFSRWRNKRRFVCADAESLPLTNNSVDMIFSNVTIQWVQDLDRTLAEFQRVLKPEGLLMFTTFGPDTLTELRQAWAAVDDKVHVNAFLDMHDIGDALVRSKVADPVMDSETITLTYRDPKTLMRELKGIGAHNVTAGRNRGLTGKQSLTKLLQAYEQFRLSDGTLPASYEVVYGHAWGSNITQRADGDGSIAIPLHTIQRRR